MPLSRPNTVIFQEYADISVVPATPFLNSLIVGPCYQLLDYLDDMDDCYAGLYGTLQMAYPRTTPTAAVVIATPPELETGAILEDDSVSIFFDEAQVVMTEVTAPGASTGVFYADDTLFTTTNNTGSHMNRLHVQAGDTLIAQVTGTVDCVKTVKELAFTLYDVGTGNPLNFTTVGVDTGDIITVSVDEAGTTRDGVYTVKKKYIVNGSVVATAIEIEDATGLALGQEDLAHVRITTAGGTKKFDSTTDGTTNKVSLGDWCNLRVTTDFEAANAADCRWRIERQLSDVELTSSDFVVNPTTKAVTVGAGITTIVSTIIGAKAVSYAKMYMQYKALRLDLQNVAEVSSPSEAVALLGKYDARNPLCVGVHVALANTTTPIKCYGIAADTLAGYGDFIERTSHLSDIYAVTPLTYDTSIIGSLKDAWENYADPDYVLSHGIKQKFRNTLGAVDLVTQSDIVTSTGGASTLVKAGTIPAGNKTITIVSQVGQAVPTDFSADGVLPGDIVTITLAGAVIGPYTVAHVNSSTSLEVEEALPNLVVSSNALDHMTIKDPTGVTTRSTMVHTAAAFTLDEATLDALYLTLSVPDATFITDGVVPGDLLQMPSDPEVGTAGGWATYDTWEVASVDSETRLTIANNGNNSSDLENELPHLVKRTAATDRAVTQGTLYFRIKRDMTKTEQVNYMLAVAHSMDSKRALLCYPNSVDVTDLVDGSKTRTGTAPELADPQPGYYLACMVAGQTASQPSQQGFTNMGGNGIARVYNSSDYFSEEQLTNLSNGGVYVFVQDAPAALPYTIHEVTTDVLSLETGEYMHVKNLDYLSMSFLDTLRPFNGKWNITPDAITFITQALYAVINTHKTAYKARIGAPLLNATVRTVYQNTDVAEDRIEAYVDASTPTVLNTIGLHLVA